MAHALPCPDPLTHMMDGMMGSLLVIKGGEIFTGLPVGESCPADTGGDGSTIAVQDFQFFPKTVMVSAGQTVTWNWRATTTRPPPALAFGTRECRIAHTLLVIRSPLRISGKTFPYFCSIHGGKGGVGMPGSIMVM